MRLNLSPAAFAAFLLFTAPVTAAETSAPADLQSCLALMNGVSQRLQGSRFDDKAILAVSPKISAMAQQCMANDFAGAFKTHGEIGAILDAPAGK